MTSLSSSSKDPQKGEGKAGEPDAKVPEKNIGPSPSGRTYKGLPVPFFFREKSAVAFREMEMRQTDVVMCSLVKGGTTWMHKILFSLLRGFDDDGNVVCVRVDSDQSDSSEGRALRIGSEIQVYPESLPVDEAELELERSNDEKKKYNEKDYCLTDMFSQPEPRLFSTHLFGDQFLPEILVASGGTGRLVVVLRNLKDVMVSLHFFRGEAKDGWHGNEHGPGSFTRYLSDECPNAYGSVFHWIKETDAVVDRLSKEGRVLVVYYESLKADLLTQLDRLNDFLDLPPLTDAKRAAVADAVGFQNMKRNGEGTRSAILRKGMVGDWKNHLDEETWTQIDDSFDRRLGDVYIAEPLRHFQRWRVEGMPPLRISECTLDTDPREWPVFERAQLRDGLLVPDTLCVRKKASNRGNEFVRPPSDCRSVIPSERYPPVAGCRYHIFVSGICPWASSVAAARHMLGLENVISLQVADGQSDAGWVYLDGASCEPWKGRPGPFWLHEAYQLHDSQFTGRITMPVLWDTDTQTIVSNDSWSIMKMLDAAFRPLSNPPAPALSVMGVDKENVPTLFPAGLEKDVEDTHTDIYSALLNGVYKAGLGFLKNSNRENDAVLTSRQIVYAKLDQIDDELRDQPFLLGNKLTAVDLRLAMTLLRYDSSYRDAFFLTGGRGGILVGDGYPHLKHFTQKVYQVVKSTVYFQSFRQYYRIEQAIARQHKRLHPEEEEKDVRKDFPPIPNLKEIVLSVEGGVKEKVPN